MARIGVPVVAFFLAASISPLGTLHAAEGDEASPCNTDELDSDECKNQKEAKKAWDEAAALFDREKFRDAAEKFKRAFVCDPKRDPKTLINLARCYEKLGSMQKAICYQREALARTDRKKAKERKEIKATIEVLKDQLAKENEARVKKAEAEKQRREAVAAEKRREKEADDELERLAKVEQNNRLAGFGAALGQAIVESGNQERLEKWLRAHAAAIVTCFHTTATPNGDIQIFGHHSNGLMRMARARIPWKAIIRKLELEVEVSVDYGQTPALAKVTITNDDATVAASTSCRYARGVPF